MFECEGQLDIIIYIINFHFEPSWPFFGIARVLLHKTKNYYMEKGRKMDDLPSYQGFHFKNLNKAKSKEL